MTKKELNQIQQDTKWIKISFLTPYSKGEMIMKESFYQKNMKKIEKRLSNYYWIDYDYHLSLGEFILMDEEHIKLENHIKRLGYSLDHSRRVGDTLYEQKLLNSIEIYSNLLLERELQLQEKYKRKEEAHG